MTIQTSTTRASFVCNGSSTVFPVPIQAYQAADFEVIATNTVTGVATTLILNSDYTLASSGTLAPTEWTLTTQTGQLTSPYSSSYTLQVILDPTQTQLSQYTQGQQFPSLAVQTNFDRLTQMVLRLQDQLDRTVLAPDGDVSPGMALPNANTRALQYLAFDANGNVLMTNALPSPSVTAATIGLLLNPRTQAEISAGLTPTAYNWQPYRGEDIRRFGAVAGSDISAILTSMNAIGSAIYIPPGNWPIASNATVTVPLNVDYGAILTPANGITLTINASVNAGLYQIFSTASGGTIAGKLKAPFYPVEWWGATGNGKAGGSGAITNGSTSFSDANATFTAADVGKSIFIVPPQYTTYTPFIGTIASYVSATQVTISSALAWAAGSFTGLDYYYGTDDSAAIIAANATVGQLQKQTGASNVLGAWGYALAFNAGCIYLMSQQLVIGTPGVTASQALGVGGKATIAFGIASTTTDCISFGVASGNVGSSDCALENLFLDACFSGRDLIYLGGFQNPRMRNVLAQNANRDVLSIRPVAGSFIQQGDFQNLYLGPAGRNCIYVGPGSTSFVNECDFLNLVMQYPAVRLPLYAGTTGTAIFFDSTAGSVDSWNITNYKASVGWANQTGYSPLGAFFYVASGANPFGAVGITLTDGYCEQGNVSFPIGASTAPFQCAGAASSVIRVRGFYASNWGNSVTRAEHDAMSKFTVTASGTKVLATLGQAYYAGIIEFIASITDGTNTDYLRFQAIGTGGGTAHIDTIGTKATTGTAPTYTLTTSSVGNVLQVNFNNTGAVSLTISYSARVIDNGNAVVFSY